VLPQREYLWPSFRDKQPKAGENTTRRARWCVSEDDGQTWSEVEETLDAGAERTSGQPGAFLIATTGSGRFTALIVHS